MLFGTKPKVITCPLCRGTQQVDDTDENILMRDPWRVTRLIQEAQGWPVRRSRPGETERPRWVLRLRDSKIARWILGRDA
jgi:hypothetical protein